MKPSNRGHKRRLRERFSKAGLRGFHDYEILELMLSYSLVRRDTKKLAKTLLQKYDNNFARVLNAPVEELVKIKGIGEHTATLLALFKQVGDFYLRKRIGQGKCIDSFDDVLDYLKHSLKALKREVFKIIYLDTKNRIISDEILHRGTLDKSSVYPREIIRAALDKNAKSLIFVHNHPSGDITPSEFDRKLTQRLILATEAVDINVYDHVIIGDNASFSMAEEGLIDLWKNRLRNIVLP